MLAIKTSLLFAILIIIAVVGAEGNQCYMASRNDAGQLCNVSACLDTHYCQPRAGTRYCDLMKRRRVFEPHRCKGCQCVVIADDVYKACAYQISGIYGRRLKTLESCGRNERRRRRS